MKLPRRLALVFISGYALALILQAALFVRRQSILYNDTYLSSLGPSSHLLDMAQAEAHTSPVNVPRRSELLTSLAAEQALGVVAGLLLIGLPCILLVRRYARQQHASHVAVEKDLVVAAAQRLAEIEELHHADRLVTLGRLASMAHELGTPLAVVQARAQMIAGGEVVNPELTKDVEAILAQTLRMTTMVRDVLSLADQKTQIKAPVNLNRLVSQTIAMIKPLIDRRAVSIKLVPDAPDATTLGDASQLLQILTNLAMNAKQSMPAGGAITFRIGQRVAAPPRGGVASEHVFVEVCDEGSGISTKNLPRIFDTYFTTKKDTGGSGLGLSVSYQIANEHGGFLHVESKPGKGSCFTLFLPPLLAPVPAA